MTSTCDKTISTKQICESKSDNISNNKNEHETSTNTNSGNTINDFIVVQDFFMGEQQVASSSFPQPPPNGSNSYTYYRGGRVTARVTHVDGNCVVPEAAAQDEGRDDNDAADDDANIVSTAIIVTETATTSTNTTKSNNVLLRRLSSSISPPPGCEEIVKPNPEEKGMYDCVIRERRASPAPATTTIQQQHNDVDFETDWETSANADATSTRDASDNSGVGGNENDDDDDDDDVTTEATTMIIYEGSLSDQNLDDDLTVATVLAQDEADDHDFTAYPTSNHGAVWIRGQGLVMRRRRRWSLRELLFGPRRTTPLAMDDGVSVLDTSDTGATLGQQGRGTGSTDSNGRRRGDRMPAGAGRFWTVLNSEAAAPVTMSPRTGREPIGTLIEV